MSDRREPNCGVTPIMHDSLLCIVSLRINQRKGEGVRDDRVSCCKRLVIESDCCVTDENERKVWCCNFTEHSFLIRSTPVFYQRKHVCPLGRVPSEKTNQ